MVYIWYIKVCPNCGHEEFTIEEARDSTRLFKELKFKCLSCQARLEENNLVDKKEKD